jgi:hypothetical protein
MSFLRIFLSLSRAYYLPTVWSNCLAGFWLGGGSDYRIVPFLLIAATSLFLCGSFLKEAFSAGYDAQHRRWRPIAAGHVSVRTVLLWSLYWCLFGIGLLFWVKPLTGLFGLVLGCCMLAYAAGDRVVVFSPALLGLCRFALYLIGASAAVTPITGWPLWGGIVIGLYNAGAKCFAPRAPGVIPGRWPILLLTAPILLAWLMNGEGFREGAFLLSAVLGLWTIRCLRHSWWSNPPDFSLTSSGLIAGTVLADWLAVANAPKQLSLVFIILFVAAVGLQRIRPAVAKSPV